MEDIKATTTRTKLVLSGNSIVLGSSGVEELNNLSKVPSKDGVREKLDYSNTLSELKTHKNLSSVIPPVDEIRASETTTVPSVLSNPEKKDDEFDYTTKKLKDKTKYRGPCVISSLAIQLPDAHRPKPLVEKVIEPGDPLKRIEPIRDNRVDNLVNDLTKLPDFQNNIIADKNQPQPSITISTDETSNNAVPTKGEETAPASIAETNAQIKLLTESRRKKIVSREVVDLSPQRRHVSRGGSVVQRSSILSTSQTNQEPVRANASARSSARSSPDYSAVGYSNPSSQRNSFIAGETSACNPLSSNYVDQFPGSTPGSKAPSSRSSAASLAAAYAATAYSAADVAAAASAILANGDNSYKQRKVVSVETVDLGPRRPSAQVGSRRSSWKSRKLVSRQSIPS